MMYSGSGFSKCSGSNRIRIRPQLFLFYFFTLENCKKIPYNQSKRKLHSALLYVVHSLSIKEFFIQFICFSNVYLNLDPKHIIPDPDPDPEKFPDQTGSGSRAGFTTLHLIQIVQNYSPVPYTVHTVT